MKKWIPIIIVGCLVLLFRLPSTILKWQVDNKLRGLRNSDTSDMYSETDNSDSSNIYIDYKHNFKIIFPKGWEINQPISNNDIIIKAVHRPEDHKFATIIVYAWQMEDLSFFENLSPVNLFNMYYSNRADLISSGVENINNINCIWLKMKITNFDIPSYAISYYFFNKNTFYQLFGNTVVGDYSWFQYNENIFINSFKTFEFIK